ncbi:neuroguidin [Bombyx mandarina]|uniref:Neuroguidin n=1 Tax=Bombyx mandarina TaxID=7092 RepID=A0A6J2K8Q6_BOMMA|nr:neuroguidin [Bombyx mandarina]
MVQACEETEQPNIPQAMKLLKEMNVNVQQVSQLVDNMLVRVKNGELSTDKGLSFLEMKYQMLLSYLINLTYIVLRKCSGERIESDPSIDRLIEIRTVLEKIRPIDSKLKYQIDKLVKSAVVGAVSEDDPQTYRANPNNLVSKIDNSEEESSETSDVEGKKEKVKSNIYVPPKLAAVHFDEVSRTEADKKMKEKSKKQFLNSSVMRELREEYSEAPLEVSSGNHIKQSISKYEQEKTEYEENYLTRLPVTKAEKNRRKKVTTVGMLADEITGTSSQRVARKHKMKSKKGKGFKRRRIH